MEQQRQDPERQIRVIRQARGWLSLLMPRRLERLLENAVRTGNRADLNESIRLLRKLLSVAHEDNPDRCPVLNALSYALRTRYEWLGSPPDLDEALEASRQAVGMTAEDHPRRALFLCNLGNALMAQQERSDSLPELDNAIEAYRQAIAAASEKQTRRAMYLSNLSAALLRRHRLVGSPEDADEAAESGRLAVGLLPVGDFYRTTALSNLGNALLARFERLGLRKDADEAIAAGRQAVAASAEHDPSRGMFLSNLGIALLGRYEGSGSPQDIDDAIQAGREAVAATPEGSPGLALYLSNLSNALRARFWQSGTLPDVDEAIEAARQAAAISFADGPSRSGYLSNRGSALRSRFERSGWLPDLEQAIQAYREAIAATSQDDPLRPAYLSNLSNALRARHERSGARADLDEAVEAARQAVTALPEGHHNRALPLSNLATALLERYERSGSRADLDQAITTHYQAVDATPAGPGHARSLLNLAIALLTRYEWSGARPELEQAIAAYRQALAETPEDSPGRARFLSGISDALLNRYLRSGSLPDIDEAIEAGRQAVSAAPDDHPAHAVYLSNLGTVLRARYQRSGAPADLDDAIEASQRAVATVPEDDPARATCLLGLGIALVTRYEGSGALADLEKAIQASREAANVREAAPSLRMQAATIWARLSAAAARWQDATDGFKAAVSLLGRVAPRSLARGDQEHALQRVAGLANDAAACCIQAGLPHLALELLEQGRGILLGQALDTRTDLTALAEQHPGLASQFATLRDALDQASLPGRRPLRLPESAEVIAGPEPPAWLEAEKQRTTAEAFERVITEIREQPGFAGFLHPLQVRDLQGAAADGTVVVVNVSVFGSHALILTGNQILDPLPLEEITPAHVADQVSLLLQTVGNPLNWIGLVDQLADLLAWLWDTIAGSVIDRIGLTGPPAEGAPWPRLWWCLPGLLSFLPMHAAGRHTPPASQAVIDRAVSSYTPTLRALLHTRVARPATASPAPDHGLALVVAMPHTAGAQDLPGAEDEAKALLRHAGTAVLTLTGSQANHDTVIQALPAARWAHFACHGTTSLASPSESSLLLTGHQELTVLDIARLRLRDADLAYLSACSTAQPGTRLADEAIHLASAFQLAGCRDVIGTLWPVDDRTAVQLAEHVYAAIADTGAAGALHAAIRFLRDQHPDRPITWASHIHIGT
jgi:tetratricopeptide (TPR) repeat protein